MKGGNVKMDNKTMTAILLIAIIIVGGFLFFNTNTAVVSAQGNSVLKAQPDKVSINLNIEARAKTAQEAKDIHDKILDDAIIALLRVGLERKDIRTVNFNIYPEYDWTNGKQTQKGFVATQQIIIETSDFDLVAQIVDAAIDSGSLVSYINFELSEEKQSELKAKALEEAGKDAMRKAEATASGLGKKIGSLVSVKSQDFNYYPIRYFDAVAEGASTAQIKEAASNLAPQDIEVSASLLVEYKLRSF